MVNANRNHFRHSARTKREAATALISGARCHPVPALYLSHVALECALKHRILVKNGATHVDDLKRKMTDEAFKALFSGAKGHDLHHLERTSALRRYLASIGQESLLDATEWRDMGGQRPYSLRYGTETVTAREAESQIKFAATLADLIVAQTL